jgi:hypothetical protein
MKAIVLVLSLLVVANVANADPCNEIEQKKSDDFVVEYPLDDNVMKLSAYRTGLCHYMKLNKLTQDRANELFEMERHKIMTEKLSYEYKPTT